MRLVTLRVALACSGSVVCLALTGPVALIRTRIVSVGIVDLAALLVLLTINVLLAILILTALAHFLARVFGISAALVAVFHNPSPVTSPRKRKGVSRTFL
jgi:Na+-translocating ferredoxin:NAD+ oxidoreductase RnfD subunit